MYSACVCVCDTVCKYQKRVQCAWHIWLLLLLVSRTAPCVSYFTNSTLKQHWLKCRSKHILNLIHPLGTLVYNFSIYFFGIFLSISWAPPLLRHRVLPQRHAASPTPRAPQHPQRPPHSWQICWHAPRLEMTME